MEIENKKRKMRNHEVVALPQELIEKILLLLPLKSLVRFRCVSKQWFSMISDSHFTKSHFDLAPTTTNDMLIYFSPVNSVARCVDVEESIHRNYAVRIPATYEHYALRVMGSCRGFILLLNCVNGTDFVLWNPTTGFHTRVSYPSALLRGVIDRPYQLWAGIGYDKSSDDYLIVAGWRDPFEKTSKFRHRWEFFSVRNHSWKEIETGDFHSNHLIACNCGVFCNGAIHWLAVRSVGDRASVIVAFGLEEKNLSIISLPDLQGGGTPTLKLLGGYLGICYMERQTWRNELWVMKEYKVESTWTKLNVDFPDGFIPMCLTKGSKCVGRKNIKELMKFSDKGTLLESKPISCDSHTIMLMFARTLLTLPDQLGINAKAIANCEQE